MRSGIVCLLVAFLLVSSQSLLGQETINYQDKNTALTIGRNVSILEDKNDNLSLGQVQQSKDFIVSKQDVPNLNISASAFWVKFSVTNGTDSKDLVLNLEYPTIDTVVFYASQPSGQFTSQITGEFVPFYLREHKHQDYIFNLDLEPGQTRTYYLKIIASEQVQLPMTIGPTKNISEAIYTKDLLFGLYAGIILVMLFYNLFLLFSIRDRTYLYYIGYILFTGLTQACLQGYAARFFYPSSYFLANAMVVWIPALSGIFAILFINKFLRVKSFTPTLYKILVAFIYMYVAIVAFSFTGNYRVSTGVMQLVVTILAILVYITAVKISLKGYRPAKIFLAAWTIFIAAVVVFVMRNQGALPYNQYTYYAMQIGSAIVVVLLSIALADSINIFRREKEESQAQTVMALQENERIIREQNVILETKVTERTQELKVANDDLSKAMVELKEAESQLVESEKMASLGQLTAGIAHEINNPINFVTSNVKPLNRDVLILLEAVDAMEKLALGGGSDEEKQKKINAYKDDIDFDYLKQEIDQLLSGIGEGASRTAEIVKGLRIFSRLDEDDLKKADINEGLESTLIITNNMFSNHISVKKSYANLPLIECYPGKLNQVFLNIISNAVFAIKKKFEDKDGGMITITTTADAEYVYISLADNGTGMDENTKKRLFEPFFTTKDVGEGTGLGMSIAYNTINKHNGQITINTEVGGGTEFVIKLPLIHKQLI
ncbi:MAG: zraS 2 [Flavipsychrobacter sp.]|nr:zraS 2 [Flavipsychrobacter sp.]